METLPISCYIRTLNEESRIGEILDAVSGLVAETLVIDSGSTDRTCEIAVSKGARVIEQDWLGWGKQKLVGELAAQHDWILDLDADEIVSKDLASEMRQLFSKGAPDCSVYELKLVTVPPIGEAWRTSCLAWRRKLYNRSHHSMPDDKASDQLQLPKEARVGRLRGDLLHRSFPNFEQLQAKMNSASTSMAKAKKLKPLAVVRWRIFLGFPLYFWKKYFRQQMFREGTYGFACAVVMAGQRWLTDVKMYERHRGLDKEHSNQSD